MITKDYIPEGINDCETGGNTGPVWLFTDIRTVSDDEQYYVAVHYKENNEKNYADFVALANRAHAKRDKDSRGTDLAT